MFETTVEKEKALLIGVVHGEQSVSDVEENLVELGLLATTAGAIVSGEVIQKRATVHAAHYVGKGKVEEIVSKVEMLKVNLVIFDDELSPAQTKNLQKMFEKARVIDRSILILDIFVRHASSKESKTQVELAQLQYLLPRLTRAWTHLERQRGATSTRGGMGETQIEIDRRLVRNRISMLKKDLIKIETQRDTRRKQREDMFKVALVGYTNAGKSSLMNLFSDAGVLVEDKLFATLDTTVRKISVLDNEILLSDTVGFIHKLPHHLVASFKSTLQEVRLADLILIVIDLSDPQYEKHLRTVNEVLMDLGVSESQTLTVFNKIDLVTGQETLAGALKEYSDAIPVSALRQVNIQQLEEKIVEVRLSGYVVETLKLDHSQQKFLASLHRTSEVLNIDYEEDHILVEVRVRASALDQIRRESQNG
ncbi:MAG: GTPase HflX [Candidatus Marinimicrobia bacterium]|jgi:GTP-binding protein HflX|nr:GTPase HflX [Candidatus Neomarinimicrobiota bacterium]MBT3576658.1 GTPase HflX [Candidatus Neomarinimicrobiota bacterium]MBT3678914.1 GTPase HflX [Candidatus Neomarinimicrobiota bacterium]MBT3952253.1 GTPase HflX [Candidatus Neomarinimicrobiota bacterium]MBT4252914.1 GTPase HflX [Candidatus Neomarinimicrobiota bacterium]